MQDNIKEFIKKAISDLIENTSSEKKIKKLIKTHKAKIHFIPIRYRIFGGLLQSMNIQFGNFIENLLHREALRGTPGGKKKETQGKIL